MAVAMIVAVAMVVTVIVTVAGNQHACCKGAYEKERKGIHGCSMEENEVPIRS
jgi:hypothetical protein